MKFKLNRVIGNCGDSVLFEIKTYKLIYNDKHHSQTEN